MTSPPTTATIPHLDSDLSKPTTLPPASTFDILPPLHALLSRLLLPSPSQSTATTFSPTPPVTSSPAATSSGPLSPKDLATASSTVKIKIQKARAVIKGLPDIERSIEEQEEEIQELEEEVRRVGGVLIKMREDARKALAGEERMAG